MLRYFGLQQRASERAGGVRSAAPGGASLGREAMRRRGGARPRPPALPVPAAGSAGSRQPISAAPATRGGQRSPAPLGPAARPAPRPAARRHLPAARARGVWFGEGSGTSAAVGAWEAGSGAARRCGARLAEGTSWRCGRKSHLRRIGRSGLVRRCTSSAARSTRR